MGLVLKSLLKHLKIVGCWSFVHLLFLPQLKTMSFFKKHFGSNINFHGINHVDQILDGKINVLNVWKENVNHKFWRRGSLRLESTRLNLLKLQPKP